MAKQTFERCCYGDLREGDIIGWYGALLRIVKIYKGMRDGIGTTHFDVEPTRDEDEALLGKFYSHGRYGGYDFNLAERAVEND